MKGGGDNASSLRTEPKRVLIWSCSLQQRQRIDARPAGRDSVGKYTMPRAQNKGSKRFNLLFIDVAKYQMVVTAEHLY